MFSDQLYLLSYRTIMNAIEREKLSKSIIIHGRLIQLTVQCLESSSVTRLKKHVLILFVGFN